MKRLFIALVLLVISIPATPIQKDFEKRPVRLASHEWVQLWTGNIPQRKADATKLIFLYGEKRLLKGFISFNTQHKRDGYLIREDGRELFCLNSGDCWPVWDRTGQ